LTATQWFPQCHLYSRWENLVLPSSNKHTSLKKYTNWAKLSFLVLRKKQIFRT
jgi:hypothetical protein